MPFGQGTNCTSIETTTGEKKNIQKEACSPACSTSILHSHHYSKQNTTTTKMFKSILLLAVLCALALAAPVATRSSTAVSLFKRRTSSTPSSSSGNYHGRGTWFSDDTGSCDIEFDQSDMIVAMNEDQMGALSGSGSKCGQKVRVS